MEEKKIVIYLYVKQRVCLSAGIAKLISEIHILAKITSAMGNMLAIFCKAGIPHGRRHS